MKSKEKIVTFKASSEYIELIDHLGAALKLDRSKQSGSHWTRLLKNISPKAFSAIFL